ncbi:MAG TPA: endonuclease domain-containing protein [Candidatus Paceibacterota bacterium]
MNKFLANNKILKNRRRELRRNQTEAEKIMWAYLRGKQIGVRFLRQYSLGPYIIDFYCPRIKLAVELDGPVHDLPVSQEYDRERGLYLGSLGVRTVRFKNATVMNNPTKITNKLKPLLSIREVEA